MSLCIHRQFWIHRNCLVCFLIFSHTAVLWEPPKLQNSPVKWCELHLKCNQRGAQELGESRENCLAGPFDYWWYDRIIQKGTAYLPLQCVLWLTPGSWSQTVLGFNRSHQKYLHKDDLITREETHKENEYTQ